MFLFANSHFGGLIAPVASRKRNRVGFVFWLVGFIVGGFGFCLFLRWKITFLTDPESEDLFRISRTSS